MRVKTDTERWAQIASVLRQARLSSNGAGLTLAHAGRFVSRGAQAIHGWEKGLSRPDALSLLQLARLYGLDIEALLDGRLVRRRRLLGDGEVERWLADAEP